MSRIIAVLSGKGGVGKTTIATNLSTTISMLGYKTCVVDLNLTTPHLSVEFGFLPTKEEFLSYNLLPNLWIYTIPSNLYSLNNIDENVIKPKILSLKEEYSFIVLDSAPGLGKEYLLSQELADEVILVVNPTLPSLIDAVKIKKITESLGKKINCVVVNRKGYTKYELEEEDIKRVLEAPFIVSIPENKIFQKYSFLHKPVVLEEKSLQRKFMVIAKWVTEGKIERENLSFGESLKEKIKNLGKVFFYRF